MKAILVSSFVMLLCACQHDKAEQTQAPKGEKHVASEQTMNTPHSAATVDSVTKPSKEKFLASKVAKDVLQTRTVAINGEKYTTQTKSLVKGSKVFNLLMREKGVIKGSVVVVTKRYLADDLNKTFAIESVEQLANNTYRVIPNEDEQLFKLYLALDADDGISKTELEVDFSRDRNKTKAY